MAEVEVGGIKFKGGKLVIVFTLISTLGGGLWAGFEFYKDYMDMREKIESYTAPDLSGFDKKIALLRKTMKEVRREMNSVRTRVGEIQTVVRDIREDTRSDAGKLFSGISSVDKRSRTLDSETRSIVRNSESNIRAITSKNEKNIRDIVESASTRLDSKINSANTRFDSKIMQVDAKLDALESRLNKQLKRALNNPLLRK
jgi:prefoldin subunit 5